MCTSAISSCVVVLFPPLDSWNPLSLQRDVHLSASANVLRSSPTHVVKPSESGSEAVELHGAFTCDYHFFFSKSTSSVISRPTQEKKKKIIIIIEKQWHLLISLLLKMKRAGDVSYHGAHGCCHGYGGHIHNYQSSNLQMSLSHSGCRVTTPPPPPYTPTNPSPAPRPVHYADYKQP